MAAVDVGLGLGRDSRTRNHARIRAFSREFSGQHMHLIVLGMAAALAAGGAYAQNIDIQDAWVRASVPGQTATGAFMKIRAAQGATLVSASSASAGLAEVHEMTMQAGVMSMRALPGGLELAPGRTVELKSGGRHLMLMDLKEVLHRGNVVDLSLVFRDRAGQRVMVALKVPVASVSPFANNQPKQPSVHQH